jgi:hypothetical protein
MKTELAKQVMANESERSQRGKGTRHSPELIRAVRQAEGSVKEIAKRFNVSLQYTRYIRRGVVRKEVE